MKKLSIVLMLASLVSSVLGFGRELILGHYFGASSVVDAYQVSISITMTFFLIFGTGLITTFIPTYTRIKKKMGEKKSLAFTNQVVFSLMLLSTFIFIFIYLANDVLINLFASGFDKKTSDLTKSFLMISAFGIFFNNLFYISKAFLQANNSFVWASLVGIPFNIIIIVSIIFSYESSNVYFLAIGNLFALFIQALLLYPSVKKIGVGFKISDTETIPEVLLMLRSSIPVIIGVSINEINNIVSKTLASNVVGGIASLNYANRLSTFVQTIFVTTLVTLMYPHISKLIASSANKEFKIVISDTLRTILVIVLPISLISMLLSKEIIRLLFGHGEFTIAALKMTSSSLFFYSIGMVAIGYREVISRVFYSLDDTKTPMKNAACGIVLNIAISVFFYNYLKLGVSGLALATSISAIIIAFFLSKSLKRKIGFTFIKLEFNNIIKVFIASVTMISITYLLKIYLEYVHLEYYLIIFACSMSALFIYFCAIYLTNVKDIRDNSKKIYKKSFGILKRLLNI